MSNEKENVGDLMNFQVQYFPRHCKRKFEDVARANNCRVKEFLMCICDNAQEIFDFLHEKNKI